MTTSPRSSLLPLLLGTLMGAAGCGGGPGVPRPTVDLTGVVPAEETVDDSALEHLQYVIDEEGQKEFLELPEAKRAEFLRVTWAALDPTPTTPINERYLDHYRRLAYVREHFAIEKPPGWDQRGELLLRYGPPDERREIPGDVVVGVGLVPPKETWVYHWLGAAFELEDARFQGNFQDAVSGRASNRPDLERDPSALSIDSDVPATAGRPVRDIGDRDARAAAKRFEPVDAEEAMARERLATMVQRGQVELKERPRAYLHDYGGGKLDLVFDVQSFSDEGSGRTRVEVNTAIWAKDLAYRPTADGQEAVVDVAAVLKTPDYHEVVRTAERTRDRRAAGQDLRGHLVLDQVVLVTDPGEYRLALSVQDSTSRDIGIYQTEVTVPAFPAGVFAMSEVQRALDVRTDALPEEPFVKGNLQIVPYPPGTYPRDRDIHLYFEIYGLTLSPTGDALYTVQFLIRPRDVSTSSWFGTSKGRVIPGVATSYDGTGRGSNVQEYIALDPKTFDEGVYDVEVTVRDRVADRETSRSTAFGVGSR